LARLFATKYPVVGFDINQSRINGLLSGTDDFEISEEVLQAVLLDKNPCCDMAFTNSKERINESSNQWFVLFCTLRYCGMQLLYHYCSSVDKITVRI
jgi:UDP-N-acetyl-D-galactosamine dehydrogenase